MAKKLPSVLLRSGEDRRVRDGHPWAFSNEILMDPETKAIPSGSLATLRAPSGEALGLVTFNPHSLIATRLLTSNPEAVVDALFIGRRLAQAVALRDRLIGVPFYRLIHAEADKALLSRRVALLVGGEGAPRARPGIEVVQDLARLLAWGGRIAQGAA